MRLVEFTSPADQLALWKLISDTVWSSINAQAKQQAQGAAQQNRIVKPKTKVASKAKIPRPPAPKPLPIPRPLYPAKAQIKKPVQPKAVVGDKRLTNQSTVKVPNLSGPKKDIGGVSAGIAKMNAQASVAPSLNGTSESK